ncbi:MAG: hypothetical protein ACE5IR_27450, partial [bacterium]
MTDYEKCPVCYKELPSKLEANFCPFCGVRFDPNAEEPPEPQQQQAPKTEPDIQQKAEPERAGIPWESES